MSYNIKEIAAQAGVSKSTVSRIISGKGYASPEVRERVMKVIETLQYKPNAVARAMVSQRTGNIGVILYRDTQPFVSHPLYGKIVDAILEAAQGNGYSVLLTTDREMSLASTNYMLEKRVDGLILISRLRQNVIDHVKRFNLPYLMVNGSTENSDVVHIVSKDQEGGELAAEHLYSLGHRRILVLAGPQEHRSHALRLKGFQERMARYDNLQQLTVIQSPDSTLSSARHMLELRGETILREGYTALFATNDMLAIGAMMRLQEQAVLVPEDMAVMGFDDNDHAAVYNPPLTTIRVNKHRMGLEAVELLDRLIRGDDGIPTLNEYDCELVVRRSTGPLHRILKQE